MCWEGPPGVLAMWVAQAGQNLGSEKAKPLFFLLLPPCGHAIEFFLGLPKDILEVRVGEVELGERGYRGRVSTDPRIRSHLPSGVIPGFEALLPHISLPVTHLEDKAPPGGLPVAHYQ